MVVAWGSLAISLMLLAGTVIFAVPNHRFGDLGSTTQIISFGLVGVLITRARPRNAVGWLFCALALLIAELMFARNYAIFALRTHPGGLPGGDVAAWFGVWPIELTTGLIVSALVLFPHGSPPTPRWRYLVWAIGIVTAVQTVLSFGWNVNLSQPYNFPEATPPIALPGLRVIRGVYGGLQTLSIVWLLSAVVAMIVRYRRADNSVRAQLRWIMFAVVLLGVGMALAVVTIDYNAVIVFTVLSPLIPISAGIAILRYRLYEIDRIINRAAVYAVVTGLLVSAYFGLVLLFQEISPLANHSSFAVAMSTLALAALFRPLRTRVQKVVDRRFNRSRYDAVQTLQEFSVRARNEVDINTLSVALLSVVKTTMNPRSASIWLRPPASRSDRPGDPSVDTGS